MLYDKCLDSTFSSGQMDEATHEMMMKPRCGVKDKHDPERVYSRENRFTKLGELYRIFLCGCLYRYVYLQHADTAH